jgi:transposase
MRVHHNVCCGIDVHKKSVTACLMGGPADQEPQQEIRRFGTMTRDLQKLAEWLEQAGCEVATMESTGSYWKPVWNVLQGRGFKLILANAKHVRALPGEKTDRKDGKRLAELTRHGQVRPSFVPPRAIVELRDLTRYRSKLLGAGASERRRIQKVLETANIKLGSVLSDVFGVSGQRMLQVLVKQDAVDVEQVAQLSHWSLKPKMEAIQQALEGQLTAHHRFLIDLSLNHMRALEEQLVRLDEEIQRRLQPYQQEYALLQTIPGIKETGAVRILSEIGADMSAFGDGDHLSSWGGVCPGNNESAGKKFQSKVRKGNQHLLSALTECSWAAMHKKDCHFRRKYYRLKARRGSQRAIVAISHALLKCVFIVLSQRRPYEEPKPASLTDAQKRRKVSSLCRQLRELGYDVDLKTKRVNV